MKKTFIFDLDGTLLNPIKRYYKIYTDICNEHKIQPLTKYLYWKYKKAKLTEKDILLKSEIELEKINYILKKRALLLETENYLKLDSLHKNVKDFLISINQSNLILITFRKDREELIKQLKNLDIFKYFQLILNITLIENPKFISKVNLLKKEHLDITNCIYFGDTEVDILAGKYLNIPTVGCLQGIRNEKILKNLQPNYLIDSWDISQWDNKLKEKIWN